MKTTLFSFLSNYSTLSEQQYQLLDGILIEHRFPKGHHLIPAGIVADSMYFIVEGALRSYQLRDGEDITDYFFFENDFASDYASLYSQRPSLFYLECIEATTCLQFKWEDFQAIGEQDSLFIHMAKTMAESAFLEMEERTRLFHHENLETRFRWMMNKFPQVFQRVPQYHIASYLGVKAESLSRIKKSIGTSL